MNFFKKKITVNKGFTLIELLVVISIIALLLSILMPSLQKAKQSALGVRCASHLKQIGLAYLMYTQNNNDKMPPVLHGKKIVTQEDAQNYWYCFLAPYLNIKGDGPSVYYNYILSKKSLVWTCPALHPDGGLSYVMPDMLNYNTQWYFQLRKLSRMRNPSKTVSLLEGAKYDYKPVNWWWAQFPLASPHTGGSNSLFLDFHIQRVRGNLLNQDLIIYTYNPDPKWWTVGGIERNN